VALRTADGLLTPGQVSADRGRLWWIVASMAQGQTQRYTVTQAPRAGFGSGIECAQGDGVVTVTAGGRLLTRYCFGPHEPKPYLHPLMGPTDQPVTRAFPMEQVDGESRDHPHHRGVWFAWGHLRLGAAQYVGKRPYDDLWAEHKGSGRIVHAGFGCIQSGPVFGRIEHTCHWVRATGQKLLQERRSMTFYNVQGARLIDFEIALTATEDDVIFGDSKEGMMAMRVADSMRVLAGRGTIETAAGAKAEHRKQEGRVWGSRAAWCHYSGPVGQTRLGVAMFDHPSNLRHPTFWMVRSYGLFAANPFGVRAFTRDRTQDGTYRLARGRTLTFRYRLMVHEGRAADAGVASQWQAYASPAIVRVAE